MSAVKNNNKKQAKNNKKNKQRKQSRASVKGQLVIRGAGDYDMFGNEIPASAQQFRSGQAPSRKSGLLSMIPERPMESAGGYIGQKLGSYAGRWLGTITGTGDYAVPRGGMMVGQDMVPTFLRQSKGQTVLVHREFITNIVASSTAGAWKSQSFPINPGLAGTFPWLSPIAQQYEQWRPIGMVFVFKTMSSNYSSTISLGTIMMATDYDDYDAPYSNKQELDNAEFSVSCNTSQSMIHPIECKLTERFTRVLQIRSGSLATGDNLRFNDLGNFQVATEGCAANQLCGELWVTYEIELLKPQLYGGVYGNGIWCKYYRSTGAGIASDNLLGTAVTTVNNTFPSDTSVSISGYVVTFQPICVGGSFVISYYATGAATNLGTPRAFVPAYSNCTPNPPDAQLGTYNVANGTAVYDYFQLFVTIGPLYANATVTLNITTTIGTPTAGWMSIQQINPR